MESFSIVIPIKGTKEEASFISRTLPYVYSIRPSEVILSIDKPTEDENIIPKIKSVIKSYHAEKITRILEIEKGKNDWKDQQMKARYTGFLEAKNNKILQVDIDLIINKNVLKVIELVGKNNIGLVSCNKLTLPYSLPNLYRTIVKVILSSFRKARFAGLYAVWKPFWLDVEPIDVAKKFTKTKNKIRNREPLELDDFLSKGDDSHLKDLMIKKYGCVYLKDIGALILTDDWENRPFIQFSKGIYFSHADRRMLPNLIKAIVRLQPYYFCGFVHGRRIDNLSRFQFLWRKTETGANA